MATITVRNEGGVEYKVDSARISEAETDGYSPVVTNGKDSYTVAVKDLPLAAKDGFHPTEVRDNYDVSSDGLARTMNDSLPIAGSVVGGAVGAMFGTPVTGIAAAGAGYAGGAQVRDLIKQYIFKDKMESKGILGEASETLRDGAVGSSMEAGGQLAGNVVNAAVPYVKSAAAKVPNVVKDLAIDTIPYGNTMQKVFNRIMKSQRGPKVPSSATATTVPVPQAEKAASEQIFNTAKATNNPSVPKSTDAAANLLENQGKDPFTIRRFRKDIGNTNGEGSAIPGTEASRRQAVESYIKNQSANKSIPKETSGYYKDMNTFPEEPEFPIQDIFGPIKK